MSRTVTAESPPSKGAGVDIAWWRHQRPQPRSDLPSPWVERLVVLRCRDSGSPQRSEEQLQYTALRPRTMPPRLERSNSSYEKISIRALERQRLHQQQDCQQTATGTSKDLEGEMDLYPKEVNAEITGMNDDFCQL